MDYSILYWSNQGQGNDRGKGVKGSRRRAASDTSSSTSSSRSTTTVRDTMERRRRQSGRQDDVMERHRHWSVSGVSGTGALRAGVRETRPRYDNTRILEQEGSKERDDDGDADKEPDAEGEDGGEADADQGGAEAAEDRPDIQARLKRAPGVIMEATWANRAQRTRVPRDVFQAGTKKEVKKPGRGRGNR